jgi:multimeric flavodoxin WrbA
MPSRGDKMLLINCSNREKNSFKVLNDIKSEEDVLISLSNKDMKFCLGCDSCQDELEKHCVLNDYITNEVYPEMLKADKIVLATPLYMSNVNGILKNLLDRMNPFYHHSDLFEGKKVYLVLIGQASEEVNQEEIGKIEK